jgi:hypothetical protein
VDKGSLAIFFVNICWAIANLESFDYGPPKPSTSEICENFEMLLRVRYEKFVVKGGCIGEGGFYLVIRLGGLG